MLASRDGTAQKYRMDGKKFRISESPGKILNYLSRQDRKNIIFPRK